MKGVADADADEEVWYSTQEKRLGGWLNLWNMPKSPDANSTLFRTQSRFFILQFICAPTSAPPPATVGFFPFVFFCPFSFADSRFRVVSELHPHPLHIVSNPLASSGFNDALVSMLWPQHPSAPQLRYNPFFFLFLLLTLASPCTHPSCRIPNPIHCTLR